MNKEVYAMKYKMLSMVFLIVSFVFITTACGNAPYEAFHQAEQKTEDISKGKSMLTIDVDMDFNQDVTSLIQDKTWIENVEIENVFDKNQEKAQWTIYGKVNDLGFDAKLYQDESLYYLITPLLPKILVINQEALENRFGSDRKAKTEKMKNDTKSYIAENTIKQLKQLWGNIYKGKDVVKLRNIILSTPDGDVKAKEYKINLSSENVDIKQLLIESFDILASDEMLKKQLEHSLEQAYEKDKDSKERLTADQIWEMKKEWVESTTFDPITFLAYIDRDNYIIEEQFNLQMHSNTTSDKYINGLENYTLSYTLQRWDIEKDIEFTLPEITQENIMTLDDLGQEFNFNDPLLSNQKTGK